MTLRAFASCHVERPLDDRAWTLFSRLQERFPVAALLRPPHEGEDAELWLARAREAAARGPLGHHPHWTSPTHARPTGGDPAARIREEAAWMREHGLEPTLFCGGGWYSDDAVRAAVAELGYADCTSRRGEPRVDQGLVVLPTTHTLGGLAKAIAWRLRGPYIHVYFHDYDLLGRRNRDVLVAALYLLRLRRGLGDLGLLAEQVRAAAAPEEARTGG